VGVRGQDSAGERLEALLREDAIQASLQVHPTRPTTVKSRILARGQQMLRFDSEQARPFSGQEEDALFRAVDELLPQCRGIVISDYDKGLVSPSFMHGLKKRVQAQARHIPVLVDPKPGNIDSYAGVSLMTPNTKETGECARMTIRSQRDIVTAGRLLMQRLGCRHMLTTLGADGMAVFEDQKTVRRIPTMAHKVFDVTGAGDTVIATVALALASGAPLLQASILANHAAGVVVGEIGAATCSNTLLLQALEENPTLSVEDWS
jgi:rfaE bifunctional protein kinase chain/domain